MMLEIARIPVLSDNYVWLVHEAESRETTVIDPAVAEPVLDEAKRRGWRITQIWNTHWHRDHTGGNEGIKARLAASSPRRLPKPSASRPWTAASPRATASASAASRRR